MSDAKVIEEFIAREGWPLPPQGIPPSPPAAAFDEDVGPLRVYATGFGRFAITERDHVFEYESPGFHAQPDPLTAEAALDVATAFARRHVASFDQRYALGDRSELTAQSLFEWEQVRQPGEVSIYSNTIQIYVDHTTHRVRRFCGTDLDFVRTTPTKIDEAAARELLLERSGGLAVDRLTLSERPLADRTRSISVWSGHVLLEGGPSGLLRKLVLIDADTGQEIDVHAR